MKRLLLFLYPKKWRERYGNELEALLEDVNPGSRDLLDVAWGAIKMQMKTWGFAKLVTAFAVAGVVIAGISGLMLRDTYVSTAVLRMSGNTGELAQTEIKVLSRTSLSELIQRAGLYSEERNREPLEDVIERMRTRDIHIVAMQPAKVQEDNASGGAFQISFSGADPKKAQFVTRLLIEKFSRNISPGPNQNLEVLDAPSLPAKPVSPNRLLVMLLGLVAGVFVGTLFAGLRRLRRQTLIFAASFGILGMIVSLFGSYLIVPNQYTSSSLVRIRSRDEAQRAESVLRSAIDQRRLKAGVQIRSLNSVYSAMEITVTDKSPKTAQAENRNLLLALQSGETKTVNVVDPANFPLNPSSPNRYIIAFLGLGAGILSGGATARFRTNA